MIIPYIRSSSLGSYRICEHKFFLVYNLGFKEKGKFSTDAGSATHKALELLAQKKLAIQEGNSFIENEIFPKKVNIEHITIDTAFGLSWNYYEKTLIHPEWGDPEARAKYFDMYNALLVFRNGLYNPLNLNIIQPEFFFDFEIREDWAKYDYEIQGEKFSGFISLKGTMDLIFHEDYLTGMDYKTGKRIDWATGKTKNLEYLKTDIQLLLYSYAIKHQFKEDEFSQIIYFLNDGGPYEVLFDKQTYRVAEGMIKDYFWKISKNIKPKLAKNSSNFYDRRKCNWCDFNKIDPQISKNRTICDFFSDNMVNLGMDKVVDRWANKEKIFSYGAGGGRSGEKSKD